MRRLSFLTLSFLMLAAAACLPARAAGAPVVAAAANLGFALPEIAAAFERATGRRVELAFGSSGNLARQIVQGGPYELFLSADEARVHYVLERGRAEDAGRIYAVGRLALFAAHGSPVAVDPELAGLAAALREGKVRRIAIANPELAPYGAAAREVLRRQGLWEAAQGRLAVGENVSQAAQFALTGAVDAAFIPYSLARAPTLQGKGAVALLPDSQHAPIRQRMALLKGAGETARAFHAFMTGGEARAILERYGFASPVE
ncbi:MAG: molybdate ABC transporter substrate-binding protein [Burkholderiales bacterium]|nr:molybdate ABC transporter substrate-binding protein [Burkholderiales bacterium]